jgi:hypothetical protein
MAPLLPPLWIAAILGERNKVNRLVRDGEDIEDLPLLLQQYHSSDLWLTSKDNLGRTSLHHAASQGFDSVVKMLLDKGADEQAKTNNGMTPETLATRESHHHTAALLKAEGVRRVTFVAFAMGYHERLGAGSMVQGLEPEMVRMVLEQYEQV